MHFYAIEILCCVQIFCIQSLDKLSVASIIFLHMLKNLILFNIIIINLIRINQ